jgi:SAM-dependent methyltransferase
MTTKELLDSIYLIPAILDHMKNPTSETAYLLGKNGIGKAGLEEARKVEDLLRYHLKMVKTDFAPDYPSLRVGLKQYFDTYLSAIWQKLGIVDTDKRLLDYGAGSGQYSDQFLADNMTGEVMMVDKEQIRQEIVQIDFELDVSWYENYKASFDIVLLAEVLHCKDKKTQEYLTQTSRLLLKDNGLLIIVENVDYAMAYRISKIKGSPYPVLDEKAITSLMEPLAALDAGKLKLMSTTEIQQHKIYVYEKTS